MVCQSAQNNINRLLRHNSSSMDKKLTTDKKLCRIQINSIICRNRDRKKIPFKRRFKKLFRFVLIMTHFLVILSSQLLMHPFTTMLKVLLSMLKTCQLLTGKDRKKFLKKKSQKCKLTLRTLVILSKVFSVLMTAGSSVLSWFWVQIQIFWKTWSTTMVFSMVLQYSTFSKMENGNTLSSIRESHTTLRLKRHFMDTIRIKVNSGLL